MYAWVISITEDDFRKKKIRRVRKQNHFPRHNMLFFCFTLNWNFNCSSFCSFSRFVNFFSNDNGCLLVILLLSWAMHACMQVYRRHGIHRRNIILLKLFALSILFRVKFYRAELVCCGRSVHTQTMNFLLLLYYCYVALQRKKYA